MNPSTLHAHSLVEAILYLMVNPCPICRQGRLDPGEPGVQQDRGLVRIIASCSNCGGSEAYEFSVDAPLPKADALSDAQPINDTDEPSRIIDVVQWVTLCTQLVELTRQTPDRQEARWRRHRAAECITEALRFYDTDNQLPPRSAAFADGSAETLIQHPERFSRDRLLALRSRLPVVGLDDKLADKSSDSKRPWWKLW